MRYRALTLALSLALATDPLHSDILVNCPEGRPESTVTPIQYNFENCGTLYSQDTLQLAFCPALGVERLENGTWKVLDSPMDVENITVTSEEGDAEASVKFKKAGEYRLTMSYTPFVYSQSASMIIAGEQVEKFVKFLFPRPNPEPWAVITVSSEENQGKTVNNLTTMFPNRIASLDPYEIVTNGNGQILIACFTEPINVFIEDSKFGCSEENVHLTRTSGSILLFSPQNSCKH